MMYRFNHARRKSVIALVSFLMAVPAFAHSHPMTYDPTPDSTGPAPAAVTVHFSKDLEPQFSLLAVTTVEGRQVNRQKSQVGSTDAKVMTVALPALSAGTYIVHWVAVALDGHRLEGDYKFTVKE